MVHQQRARLNSFFPLSPCQDNSAVMFYQMAPQGSDSCSLWLGAGWALDTEGQMSPPDVAASATLSPQLGLPHLGKWVVILPGGISVPAGLRSDPRLPSYPVAVVGLVSLPKIWAFNSCCNELWVVLRSWSLVLCINVQKYRGQPLRRNMVTLQQSIPTRKAIKYLISWLLL